MEKVTPTNYSNNKVNKLNKYELIGVWNAKGPIQKHIS